MKNTKRAAVPPVLRSVDKNDITVRMFLEMFAAQVRGGSIPSEEAISEIYSRAEYAAGMLFDRVAS